MADIIDIANDRAQEILDEALAKIPKPAPIRGIGVCLNPGCGEPLDGERRWCDAKCRDEWEKHKHRA